MTKNYLQKASYYILKDIESIGSYKVNNKPVASSVCQVLPLECAQSLFLNLNMIDKRLQSDLQTEYFSIKFSNWALWYKLKIF